eukprot:gene15809-biopygen20217
MPAPRPRHPKPKNACSPRHARATPAPVSVPPASWPDPVFGDFLLYCVADICARCTAAGRVWAEDGRARRLRRRRSRGWSRPPASLARCWRSVRRTTPGGCTWGNGKHMV